MQEADQQSIAVLGAGSWGSALAILLARNGLRVPLWGHDPAHIRQILKDRSNEMFLPGIAFPENIFPTDSLEVALQGVHNILVVVPSHAFREVLGRIKPLLTGNMRIIWATKGLEQGSGKLLHEIADETLGPDQVYAVISGPTFAKEVAAGLPTAVTVASNDPGYAMQIAAMLHNDTFRSYTSSDIIGVELGGAVKNALAIAAGIADGLGFGANTRAALITRGLTEIMRLGNALGGHPETFMGLAGLGDLVLTCTDNQSRNRRFGMALAQGMTQQQAFDSIGQVVEGAQTAREVIHVARRYGVEMPITEQVKRVLSEGVNPRDAVHELFARELKPEFSEKI